MTPQRPRPQYLHPVVGAMVEGLVAHHLLLLLARAIRCQGPRLSHCQLPLGLSVLGRNLGLCLRYLFLVQVFPQPRGLHPLMFGVQSMP